MHRRDTIREAEQRTNKKGKEKTSCAQNEGRELSQGREGGGTGGGDLIAGAGLDDGDVIQVVEALVAVPPPPLTLLLVKGQPAALVLDDAFARREDFPTRRLTRFGQRLSPWQASCGGRQLRQAALGCRLAGQLEQPFHQRLRMPRCHTQLCKD